VLAEMAEDFSCGATGAYVADCGTRSQRLAVGLMRCLDDAVVAVLHAHVFNAKFGEACPGGAGSGLFWADLNPEFISFTKGSMA
jgi:hypothetical protein